MAILGTRDSTTIRDVHTKTVGHLHATLTYHHRHEVMSETTTSRTVNQLVSNQAMPLEVPLTT